MTNETLANLLADFFHLPETAVDEIAPTVLHHTLNGNSPLRNRGYLSNGELFVKIVEQKQPTSVGYFWLNMDTWSWDLHFYTVARFRRRGMATEIFYEGILPWLRINGYRGERIRTTELGTESIGLLKKLGFIQDGAGYDYGLV